MRRSAGFTLVEALAGLVILSLIITTSLAVFFERERRLREAADSVVVWQALANEAEYRRHMRYAELLPVPEESFKSDTSLLQSLDHARAVVKITLASPQTKRLTLTVTWGKGKHSSLEMLRATIPGGALF